ncbi:MAG: oligosaccharide flippase family protein [Gemmatimonadaceae bacterium]|nr:oligosaccharide flippase family protein [Gemmatimonadaceae bacterium]
MAAALPASPDPTSEPAADRAPIAEHRDLDRTLARGVAWLGVMRSAAQAITWASTVLVARILSADDYGIVSIAAIFVGLPGFFTEFGVARSIILERIRDDRVVAQLHAVCIALGAAFTLLLLAVALPVARAFGEPRLGSVLAALAVTALFGGIAAVPMARVQQALDYRRVAVLELVRSLGQTGTVLVLALAGARYWALPAGILVASLLYMLAAVRVGWLRPRRPLRAQVAAPLAYARHVIAGPLLWHVAVHSDFAVVGRVLDIAAVGFYQFAWNLAALPGEKITNVVQGAAGPFFGSIGGDHAALRRYLLIVTESLAILVIPVLVGFICVAPEVIPLVFGAKWQPAVLALQILVLYALAQNLVVIVNLTMNAAGFARLGTITGAVLVVVVPGLFWLAASMAGIIGVAAVWAVVQPALLLVPLLVARRAFGLSLRAYATTLAAPSLAAAVMATAVWTVAWLLRAEPAPLRAVAMIGTGAVTYVATLWLVSRERLLVLRGVWSTRRQPPAVAALA